MNRARSIGMALSVGWFLAASAFLTHQRSAEISRLTRECHQIQDEARANSLCNQAGSAGSEQRLCSFKDADCDHWPLEEARYKERIGLYAVVPIVLGWLAAYAALRRRPRRP